MAPKLAYWRCRGLAQPIRMLLGYTRIEFEDFTYPCSDSNAMSSWFSVKEEMGMDFPNLPYYIDGDIKVTQSNAILRYLARKHGLDGKTEEEKMRIDILLNVLFDFRSDIIRTCFKPEFDQLFEDLKTRIRLQLKKIDKFRGDRKFFASDEISFVDFLAHDVIHVIRNLDSKLLDDFPRLKVFMDTFEAVPSIKEYMNSDTRFKGPFFNYMAIWNGGDEE